ncbi:hypothetical protein [Bacillus toyonensis]|uniref:Uncharacterized protein n=1 Tax=Bacillus toyonensis TaxID=155322 RepID=A0A2B5CK28_9BACI|nr:hypothetical protein [Bacillus toyonensis]PEJ98756.1 hypothetical protein CN688_05310 [Bacillus toyonensis]PEK85025.1 hypothetical protein CN594_15785 [Bacillus toyonensis]PEL24644.1 hypothetical protein CN624_17630 [Bacillus toyonensis]PEO60734.1 hypothetical protein CN579_16945 [Bacillus toyonensis]PFY35885.1 hypothetical protein COL54_28030 [Bacillus toyonensis]
MELLRWELLDEFKAQDNKALEFQRKYKEKLEDEKKKAREAVENYEAILLKEFAGENVATAKKKVLVDIEKANEAVKVAEEERIKAVDYANKNLTGSITADDLHDDFIRFRDEVREKVLQPILDRQRKALADYYQALADHYMLSDAYKDECETINQLTRKRKGSMRVSHRPTEVYRDAILPKDADLEFVRISKEVPTHLQGGE